MRYQINLYKELLFLFSFYSVQFYCVKAYAGRHYIAEQAYDLVAGFYPFFGQ